MSCHAAAANLRPATMELGGKSALIVFDDADVEKAVEWAMVRVTHTHTHRQTHFHTYAHTGKRLTHVVYLGLNPMHVFVLSALIVRSLVRSGPTVKFAAPRLVCWYTRQSRPPS